MSGCCSKAVLRKVGNGPENELLMTLSSPPGDKSLPGIFYWVLQSLSSLRENLCPLVKKSGKRERETGKTVFYKATFETQTGMSRKNCFKAVKAAAAADMIHSLDNCRAQEGLPVLLHLHHVHQGALGGREDPRGLRQGVQGAPGRGIRELHSEGSVALDGQANESVNVLLFKNCSCQSSHREVS